MFKAIGFFCTVIFSTLAHAAGGATSSGGDPTAADFTRSARYVLSIVQENPLPEFSPNDLEIAINTTHVYFKDRVFHDGQEVTAVNYPSLRKIEVGKLRWRETANMIEHRYVLVLHEYLNIMGIEDHQYQVSQKLFSASFKIRRVFTCEAFEDLNPILEKNFKAKYIQYDNSENFLMITDDGYLPPHPIGNTLGTGAANDGKGYVIIAFNVGRIRIVQIPIDFEKTDSKIYPYSVTGYAWDNLLFGETANKTEINCTVSKW